MYQDLRQLTVGDCMTATPIVLSEDTPLAEAYATLLGEGVHGAPVMGGEGNLLGLVTVSDLLAELAPVLDPQAEVDAATLTELKAEPLSDTVPLAPVTCSPGLSLVAACRLMTERRVHSLVVVQEGRPVGVLSASDAVRAVGQTAAPEA